MTKYKLQILQKLKYTLHPYKNKGCEKEAGYYFKKLLNIDINNQNDIFYSHREKIIKLNKYLENINKDILLHCDVIIMNHTDYGQNIKNRRYIYIYIYW
jgi:hypothetical protein